MSRTDPGTLYWARTRVVNCHTKSCPESLWRSDASVRVCATRCGYAELRLQCSGWAGRIRTSEFPDPESGSFALGSVGELLSQPDSLRCGSVAEKRDRVWTGACSSVQPRTG